MKKKSILADLYTTQISLTEWFEKIHHKDTAQLRDEDNTKRARLSVLHDIIGLPFDKPTTWDGSEIARATATFKKFITDHGGELCALRLIPKDTRSPKLRMRGRSIADVVREWLHEQHIDLSAYTAEFVPHSDNQLWSTIFIVNKHGISGEIIRGRHHQLTQGLHDEGKPISFYFDFTTWQISHPNKKALACITDIVEHLHVKNASKRSQLTRRLHATFSHTYLDGYFETTMCPEYGLWFIDYNRILGKIFSGVPTTQLRPSTTHTLYTGRVGHHGTVTGIAHIVHPTDIKHHTFKKDEILVCPMTTPEYVVLMQRAAGIITDFGGILSHAAIIARELGVPCLVGTEVATTVLKNGDIVRIDTSRGCFEITKNSLKK